MSTLNPLLTFASGFAFNWALQSVLTVQVYIYYLCFPNDSKYRKCLVYAVCIYEWVQTALVTADIYQRFITEDTSYMMYFASYGISWITLFMMPALTAAIVQLFYAWRIAVVSQRRVYSIVILLVVMTAFCSGIVSAVSMKNLGVDDDVSEVTWDVATQVWLWCSVLVDYMIAGFMIYTLRRFKTMRTDTDLLVNRVIRLVIETGCLTVAGAIATLICWNGFPRTSLAACPLLVLSKLYANTMMINLNNRAFIQSAPSGVNMGRSPLGFPMSSPQTGRIPSSVLIVADSERSVEVALPSTADADQGPFEVTK
ncbi:uncharacterized protein B0H18DRAFT_1113881 [Fomitopsis serialis]|uniref:uncharacterized protein n=1 Tax=Fomitopsis serialis TaxID=139415 RepID=UPI002008AFA4|nr:uncharacterized protein B0H18DRAFT_1113881 [Neoantrodia serialis]KAH9936497.1 hypothetical protein B0H18DRAFT_1113881 [Neoantrodia serialis]